MTETTTAIKTNYKHTQLGWIPEEWEVKSLDELLKIGNGRDYKHLSEGNIPVYGTGGIMRYVNDYLFDGESVGIGRKGTIDKPVYLKGKFWTVDTLFYCHSFKNSIAIYIYYLFLTINWRKYNEASGVPSLSQNTIKKIRVALPPLPEQQKIAAILSTWDRAIAQQQQLIAAKQQFKKGLMQRLLTGQQRFAGFEGEWEEVKLFKVCEFKNGKAHEQIISDDGEFVVVNSKFISTNGEIRKFTSQQVSPLFKNEIVMVMSDVPNGRALAKCYLIEEDQKYSLNQRICSLKAKDIEPLFLYYQLNRNKYYLKFNDGIGQTNLKKKEVLNCPIFKPSRAEQIKILSILSSADQEINVLQTQLTQLQTQKRGLMQGLLTGVVRVKK